MFRAGDPKMINDFSQAELCPPPSMCRAPLPSLASFFAGRGGRREDGAGRGRSKAKLTDHKENAGTRALCYKGQGVLVCFIFIVFVKTVMQSLYFEKVRSVSEL